MMEATRPILRTFDNFPGEGKCPVCKTNENDKCVLIAVEGTSREGIIETRPVHLACAIATYYNKEYGLLYRKI